MKLSHKQTKDRSVSVVVMAYNEENNIKPTIDGIIREFNDVVGDYEIVIIDDGSTDKTGLISEQLAKRYHQIRVYHHAKNLGFGQFFLDGVNYAKKKFVIGFPGDDDTSPVSLKNIALLGEESKLIISYTSNPQKRSFARRAISKLFVVMMNLIFNLNLRYFNGSFLCETKVLQNLHLQSKGLAIYAEAKIRLLKQGYSYIEVPFEHIGRKFGHSKAVSVKSLMDTLTTLWFLIRVVYFAS